MPGRIVITGKIVITSSGLREYPFRAIREGGGRHSIGLGKDEVEALADLLSNEDAHKDCEDCAKEEASDG